MRHSVKDSSAKSVIEGLSRTGEQYNEAIECLQARFDRPRLIHQAHVRKVLEIPPLKEGSGKELRHLHDVAQQHLRALKSMGQEPSGAFITSMLELKLDAGTMFEWQKHSHDEADVPHYQDLLDFINLRAQASETSVPPEGHKKTSGNGRGFNPSRSVTSLTANTGSSVCVLCKPSKHPLYSCPKFKSMSLNERQATVKGSNVCMNCLRSGHFAHNCKSSHRCRECQKPHHSLLHFDSKSDTGGASAAPAQTTTNVQSNTAMLKTSSLLMTCQVMIVSPNGSSMKARALLDSGSSASFVSERMAWSLHLPRS